MLGRYNIFAVGFDLASQPPNTKLLISQGWRNLLNSMPTTDAYTQTYSVSGTYCFAAVLSLVGEHGAVFSLPNNQYYQQVLLNKGSNTVLAFASTKDKCQAGQT